MTPYHPHIKILGIALLILLITTILCGTYILRHTDYTEQQNAPLEKGTLYVPTEAEIQAQLKLLQTNSTGTPPTEKEIEIQLKTVKGPEQNPTPEEIQKQLEQLKN
jgi:hypothetical protein